MQTKIVVVVLLQTLWCSQCQSGVSDAQARFAVDIMGQICGLDNCVFSPYSIFNVLSMVELAAGGETSQQMVEALRIERDDKLEFHAQVGAVKQALLQDSPPNTGVELRVADNVFVGNVGLNEDYINYLNDVYLVDGPKQVNFLQPEVAVSEINQFVSDVTRGEIQDFLSPDLVSPRTLAVLVNALFFKGNWKIQFDPDLTKKGNFSISRSNKVEVDMMVVEGEFRFTQSRSQSSLPKFDILEMPYENEDYVMDILLPYTSLNLARDEIQANDLLINFDLRLANEFRVVHVQIPKFTISVKTDIKEALINMGMTDLFQTTANLSGMSPLDQVYVSSAIHEAKVDVNEQGTVATAATAVGVYFESSVHFFEVQQPFMFTIVHKPSKAILLMGQVVDPRIST